MKKKRVTSIRKSLISTAIIASIINSKAAAPGKAIKPAAESPETSQTIVTNTKVQREILPGGLIVDQATLKPIDIKQFGPIFGTIGDWKTIDDEFEGKYNEDGTLIERRNHPYLTIDVKTKSNNNGTHEIITTKKCLSCGNWLKLSETEKCKFDKGTIKGNKTIYTCQNEDCGYTYTKIRGNGVNVIGTTPSAPEHNHLWEMWKYLDENTEQRICTTDRTHTEIQGHNLKTNTSYESTDDKHHVLVTSTSCDSCKDSSLISKTIGEELECNFIITDSVTDESGVITDTYRCSIDGCKNFYTQIRRTEPIHIDMESLLSIDPNSLVFDYDGQPHFPLVSGFPDNVTPHFISVKGIDAGEYVWRIEFDVPEGYIADPVEISYTIKPAIVNCSYNYNETTGEVNAVYSGVVGEDVKQIIYTVNGKKINCNPILNQYGFYKVESNIEINPDKLGNYTFSKDLNECAMYDVKREKTWYEIDTECHKNGDEITVDVYLSASKLPYFAYYDDDLESMVVYCMPSLVFNIYFDKTQLGFEPNGVLTNADGWDGVINESFEYDNGYHNFVTSPDDDTFEYWDGLPDKVKICQLTFKQKEEAKDAKNITINIADAEIGTGSDEYPFEYITNASACIINSSTSVEVIKHTNDLIADAIFQDTGDMEEEEAIEVLQEYIDNDFQFPAYIFSEEAASDIDELQETDVKQFETSYELKDVMTLSLRKRK